MATGVSHKLKTIWEIEDEHSWFIGVDVLLANLVLAGLDFHVGVFVGCDSA